MSTANTTPTPAQMMTALQSQYYGMAWLALAAQAYTAEGDWNEIPMGLYTALTQVDPTTQQPYTPPLPAPGQAGIASPEALGGAWSLDWGPANGQNGDGDNSNLVYLASFRAQGNPNYADGAPYCFVVGIRGTDTSVAGKALWQQIGQDLRAFTLWSWPKLLSGGYDHFVDGNLTVPTPNTGDVSGLNGNIAHGSMLGFVKIANSTAPLNDGLPPDQASGTAVPVVEALNSLLEQYPGTPVVVTGHSLGACQAQVMAAYLAWQLGGQVPVIPQVFAPPTPGDQDFVDGYQSLCPNGGFWYCSLDLVPYAYITVQTVKDETQRGLVWAKQNLWTASQWPDGGGAGPHLPGVLSDLIATIGHLVPTSYQRPAIGQQELVGALPSPAAMQAFLDGMGGRWADYDPKGSDAQLAWQHFPPNYFQLMWSQYADSLAQYTATAYKPDAVMKKE